MSCSFCQGHGRSCPRCADEPSEAELVAMPRTQLDAARLKARAAGGSRFVQAVLEDVKPAAPRMHAWEDVAHGMRRMRVPGGWLYQAATVVGDHSRSIPAEWGPVAFVPAAE